MTRQCFIPSVLLLLLLSGWTSSNPPLPGDDAAHDWKRSGKFRHFVKTDLYNHINGGAELFHEFGFEEVFVQRYANGEMEITVEMYRMSDAVASLGIYLMKSGKETPLDSLPVRHSADRYGFIMVRGDWFIQIHNPDGLSAAVPAIKTYAEFWIDHIAESSVSSPVSALPNSRRVEGSVRLFRGPYALESIYTFGSGDILSLKNKVCGVAADYMEESETQVTRLLIPYNGESEALTAFQVLQSHLDPYITVIDTASNTFSFQDYRSEYGVVKRLKGILDIRIHLLRKPRINDQ